MNYTVILLSLFLIFVSSDSSKAQWLNMKKDDAFADEIIFISATFKQGYLGGFNCTKKEKNGRIIFVVPEKYEKIITNFRPDILIRIDRNPIKRFKSAIADDADGKMRFIAQVENIIEVLQEVRTAKSRVAFAIELIGQRMHSISFSARQSTKAMTQLIAECELSGS